MMPPTDDPLPRLSSREALILELLGRAKSMYGLELVAASEGALKRGTVYVTLGRMEEKGYVSSRLEDASPAMGGMPRRLYTATPHGRAVLSAMTAMRRRLLPREAR